jgi:hypothetical protein
LAFFERRWRRRFLGGREEFLHGHLRRRFLGRQFRRGFGGYLRCGFSGYVAWLVGYFRCGFFGYVGLPPPPLRVRLRPSFPGTTRGILQDSFPVLPSLAEALSEVVFLDRRQGFAGGEDGIEVGLALQGDLTE